MCIIFYIVELELIAMWLLGTREEGGGVRGGTEGAGRSHSTHLKHGGGD